MRRIVMLLLVVLISCGGKTDDQNASSNAGNAGNVGNAVSNNDVATPYFEVPPTSEALAEILADVQLQLEDIVEESLRADLVDYVTSVSPAALRGPESETEAWVFIGFEAFLLNDYATAAWCFLQAYAVVGEDDPWVLSQVGFALIALDYRQSGKDALLRAYELDNDFLPTLLTLGFTYELDEDFARAAFFYLHAQSLHSENIYLNFPVARAFMGVGRFDAATTLLQHVVAALPDITDAADALEMAQNGVAPEPQTATPGSAAADAASKFWADYFECTNTWLVDYTASVAPLNGSEIELQVYEAWRASDAAIDACWDECNDSLCDANCLAAKCASDSATIASASQAYIAAYWNWNGADAGADSRWGACAFGSLFTQRRHFTPMFAKQLEDSIWDQLQERVEGRREVFVGDVVATIEGWNDDVSSTCSEANTALEMINPFEILTTDTSNTVEMCGNGVCIRWDGPVATVDIQVGGISISARGESMKGWTATLGFDVWSNDNASVSILMRFDSSGDVSLDLEGKATGPVSGFERKLALSTR